MNTISRRDGMAVPLVLTIILVLAALGGAVYFRSRSGTSPSASPATSATVSATPSPDAMKNGGAMPVAAPFVPGGSILSGRTSLLVDFNKADYDKAVAEGRVVLLYFYANWCPICKSEFPKAEAAFNELNLPGVVGFRVNYNDNETDQYETALARQFGVAYQHTKVILKDGQQVLKNGEGWDKDRYLEELGKAAQ